MGTRGDVTRLVNEYVGYMKASHYVGKKKDKKIDEASLREYIPYDYIEGVTRDATAWDVVKWGGEDYFLSGARWFVEAINDGAYFDDRPAEWFALLILTEAVIWKLEQQGYEIGEFEGDVGPD